MRTDEVRHTKDAAVLTTSRTDPPAGRSAGSPAGPDARAGGGTGQAALPPEGIESGEEADRRSRAPDRAGTGGGPEHVEQGPGGTRHHHRPPVDPRTPSRCGHAEPPRQLEREHPGPRACGAVAVSG